MAHALNISSEEELLQLRNEGKISEAEYQDLLAAIQKASKDDTKPASPEENKARSKHKLGKIAFALMLTGIILPALFYFMIEILSDPNIRPAIGPLFFLGVAFEIAAFVMGVIAWPDVYGKSAVLTTSALTVLTMLLFLLIA
jgi:hypothetical protein